MKLCCMRLASVAFTLILLLPLSSALAKTSTLVHCPVGLPEIFNPSLSLNANTIVGTSHLYNTLVNVNREGNKILPELVKSWKLSNRGRRIEMVLNENVWFHSTDYFQPTRPLNSDDVIFTFHRSLKKDHPYHKVGKGNYPLFSSSELSQILVAVEKVSEHKFAFILKKAYSPLLYQLAFAGFPILSKEYADHLIQKDNKNQIDILPIGTGPFQYSKQETGRMVRYKRHSKYFRGPAKIEQLILVPVPEASVRLQKLKAGECDVIDQPHAHDVTRIQKNKKLMLMTAKRGSFGFVSMNNQVKPFDDPRVRKAISLALDKRKYVKTIYNRLAMAAKNPLSSYPGYEEKDIPKRDLKTARKLLAQAGYSKGFDTELWTLPVDRPYITNGKKLGELMQADLREIGVRAKLVTFDWPTYLKKTRDGEHKMAMLGWMNPSENPDQFLSINLTCQGMKTQNISRWCNPQFDSLLEKARREMDRNKRKAIYKQAVQMIEKENPWVSVAHGYHYIGTKKKLSGIYYSTFGEISFEKAHWLQ